MPVVSFPAPAVGGFPNERELLLELLRCDRTLLAAAASFDECVCLLPEGLPPEAVRAYDRALGFLEQWNEALHRAIELVVAPVPEEQERT